MRTANDVREMDEDFREAMATDAVKTWDIGFRHGRILGVQHGAAVAFGLLAMAEAIRARPRYQWKVVTFFGASGNHAVSWHSSEALAIGHAAASAKPGDRPPNIIRQEIEWCNECALREAGDDRGAAPDKSTGNT